MRKLATVLVTMVLFILVVLLAGLVGIYSGAYDVAADRAHTGVIRWVLRTATEQSIAKHAQEVEPVELSTDSTTLWRGFNAFEDMCVQCHGAPGVDRGWIGKGVKPTPPHLHEEAAQMNDAELYWVIRHGIKFTSMPALQPTHTDEQIRELAAFVRQLPTMDSTEFAAWRGMLEGASSDSASMPAQDGHVHEDGHAHTH